jgi:hypothetical protein
MRNPALRLSEDAVDAEFFFWGTRLDDYLGQNFYRAPFRIVRALRTTIPAN